ncbi:MAG TPA: malectin domain-containing carbohydrate-binding protein [Pilimelia sp.]|nr:malectin domain-containing carbohydrate-binding protein [Pilimelia sp.]
MPSPKPVGSRPLALVCAAVVAAGALVAVSPTAALAAAAPPGHPTPVSAVPKAETPSVRNGQVDTIYDAGETIIAGGTFTTVRSTGTAVDKPRSYLFGFDEATGAVSDAFAPVVDGAVTAVIAGPTPGTVFIGGRFNTVNGVNRRKVALLNVADGSLVTSFTGPAFNGAVQDLALAAGHLLVGGNFTTADPSNARGGLASVNATTGALTGYLTATVTENHNWTPGSTNARAPVGVDKLALAPDGSRLIAIGNFKKVNGAVHDQVVIFELDGSTAAIANWDTERYRAPCFPPSWDSYVRDVAFSPDGSYFVIVTTGGKATGTLCDAAARWETAATGTGLQPTWIADTGGDTLLSVAISEQVVYIGGHQRWVNNPAGTNSAAAGAIARPSLAALDPRNGLPTAWNPGRHPRGIGVSDLTVTPAGLWVGSDQEYIGNQEYKRDRIAFFPVAGGAPLHSTATPALPRNVHTFGANKPAAALYRINAGGELIQAADGALNWRGDLQATPDTSHNAGTGSIAGRTWVPAVDASAGQHLPREVFNSERHGNSIVPNLLFDVPVARGTTVQVRLFFASRCTCAVGFRKFHVNIDGVRKLTDFDVTAAAGNDKGIVRVFSVTSDGVLDIDLLKGSAWFPFLNAIEVVRTPAPTAVGTEDKTYRRSYDGAGTVGPRTELPLTAYNWSAARGGFWVGGTLFYNVGTVFRRRTFDGSTLGAVTAAEPYRDPKWDTVITDVGPPGQTFAGALPDFWYEIPQVTGMFYSDGRVYYTMAGHTALYWRAFTPDSGAIGAQRFTAGGTVSFADSGGVFVSEGNLYLASRSTGNLSRLGFTDGVPTGTPTVVSGPGINGQDWRAKVIFVGP